MVVRFKFNSLSISLFQQDHYHTNFADGPTIIKASVRVLFEIRSDGLPVLVLCPAFQLTLSLSTPAKA
jgi:hypothetical protein